MATDLFGNPLGANPVFKLSLHQKRQAAMLYQWMSLDYLKGLLQLIDGFITGVDVTVALAQVQGRDALLANDRWGVRDTSSNWSTHVLPAMESFRRSILKDVASRATESYEFTGANQCGRMIAEHSSMWMTSEEEEHFNQQWEVIYSYAAKIDAAVGAGGQRPLTDFSMVMAWRECESLWRSLPKFRVRTDVEGLSGKKPPRTGVYVAQEDPYASLQFAWIGNADGVLGDAKTFNELGMRLVGEVGRDALWIDDTKLIPFALREMEKNSAMNTGMNDLARVRAKPARARNAMASAVFTDRPCKWYFVEMLNGEFENVDHPNSNQSSDLRLRCEAGNTCPRQGWWFTPAAEKRQHFKQGELMPALAGDYGVTIWQWDGE